MFASRKDQKTVMDVTRSGPVSRGCVLNLHVEQKSTFQTFFTGVKGDIFLISFT